MYDTFKVPCILLGFGLPDENAHAPDEHIALENYFGGIKAVAQFYEGLAEPVTDPFQVNRESATSVAAGRGCKDYQD